MKTRKTMFGIFTVVEGGMEAAVSKPNGVFAKQKLLLLLLAWTLIAIGCDNGDKETHTHQWEWVETKAATATAEGEETETCATCGQTNRTRPIQKLPEQPQFRETTITLTFGENTYTAKVQGTLLQAQWTGTADKIKDLLEAGYADAAENGVGGRFTIVFSDDVTIIVEKTTEYNEYEKFKIVNGQFRTLYLNVDALDDDYWRDSSMGIPVSEMRYERPTNYTGYATKPLTFGTTENPCSVTVTSEETFTTTEWNTLVDKVVAAIETAYTKETGTGKGLMRKLIGEGVTIVLEKNPTGYPNYKVGGETLRTLYLNVDSIETAAYGTAIRAMNSNSPEDEGIIGKVSPINIFDFDTTPSAYIKCA